MERNLSYLSVVRYVNLNQNDILQVPQVDYNRRLQGHHIFMFTLKND